MLVRGRRWWRRTGGDGTLRREVEQRGQERAPDEAGGRVRFGRFAVRTHVEPGRRTLALGGELDLASAPKLERAVGAALTAGARRLVLDLRRLEFIDASGLHSVVQAREACRREGCEFALVPGPRQVQRVFELTGTLKTLEFSGPAGVEAP
jgi:anti-sigma B factor antagonist